LVEKEEQRAAQYVFETDTPGLRENLLQGLHDAVCGDRPSEWWDVRERVEAPGLLRVRNIEVDEIRPAGLWHPGHQPFHEIAVRIEEGEAGTI
jgi:hypothetical protein